MRLFTTLDMVDHNVQVLNGEYSLPPEILSQCRNFIDVGHAMERSAFGLPPWSLESAGWRSNLCLRAERGLKNA